jgi:hypothetical protein
MDKRPGLLDGLFGGEKIAPIKKVQRSWNPPQRPGLTDGLFGGEKKSIINSYEVVEPWNVSKARYVKTGLFDRRPPSTGEKIEEAITHAFNRVADEISKFYRGR